MALDITVVSILFLIFQITLSLLTLLLLIGL